MERPPITPSFRALQLRTVPLPKSKVMGSFDDVSEGEQAPASNAVPISERIQSILQEPANSDRGSLADAEVAEDVVEQVVGCNGPSNPSQLLQGFAVVDGQEVAAEAHFQSI